MMRKVAVSGLCLLAGIAAWLAAQAGGPESLARWFPPNPVLYLEARDFAALLGDWNASAEKKTWLASENYSVFSNSRLFLRLAEAQGEFAEAAAVAPDAALLNAIAGGQSALAIYDIGQLQFLYVTRLASAAALTNALWNARTSYESRNSDGRPYFVRVAANGRVSAFAAAEGLLLLATREDLIAGSLALLGGNGTPLARDRWFDAAVTAGTAPGDLRLVLNLPALVKSPHFRSYWIEGNVSDLRSYTAGVVDLFREAGQMREERAFVRDQPSAVVPNEVSQIAALAPPDAGFYRAWSEPRVEGVLDVLSRKIMRPGLHAASTPARQAPMAAQIDSTAGTEADLEVRIDESQPPAIDPESWRIAARPLLERAAIRAMMVIQSSRELPGGTFVGNESTVVLRAANDWPATTGTAFAEASVHVAGRTLLIADRAEALAPIVARLGATAAAGPETYRAHYNHRREMDPFSRIMRMIDTSRGVEGPSQAPRFFSGNVVSLGRVLSRLESVSMIERDEGARLKQQVIYRTAP